MNGDGLTRDGRLYGIPVFLCGNFLIYDTDCPDLAEAEHLTDLSQEQLLSALAIISCAVYMKKTSRKGWMLWIPMVIMLCVTLTALVQKMIELTGAPTAGNLLQLAFAAALFILGVIVAVLGFKRLAEKTV